MFHVPLMYICVYTMYDITVYFVSENTSSQIIENGDFFAGVYESAHFSWILLVFYLMALIGSAGMVWEHQTTIPYREVQEFTGKFL